MYPSQVDSCFIQQISSTPTVRRNVAKKLKRNCIQLSRIEKSFFLTLLFILSFVPIFAVTPSTELHLVEDISIIRGGSSQGKVTLEEIQTIKTTMVSNTDKKIEIVFSDVDGTLVHFPENLDELNEDDRIIKLPTSSTGMRGVISSRTMELCQDLRSRNVKLILVSGMRTSTLIKRLPFLPRADAYACEAGGRIFYPVEIDQKYDGIVISPQKYEGISQQNSQPYGLKEDMEWRTNMSMPGAAGKDGYNNNDNNISERDGLLWEFANSLIGKGFTIDHKGYSSCFRVNKKQQIKSKVSDDDFDDFVSNTIIPKGLASSSNLGCVDFYPALSGKKNCCAYLAAHFLNSKQGQDSTNTDIGNLLLSEKAVCMCDDDNDLEMATACSRAFIPSITSESMQDAIRKEPSHFVLTEKKEDQIIETAATEAAINLILESIL